MDLAIDEIKMIRRAISTAKTNKTQKFSNTFGKRKGNTSKKKIKN